MEGRQEKQSIRDNRLMGISTTINSKATLAFMHKQIDEDFEKHKYTTYETRYGRDRSITQNALLSVWALEYGCFLAKLHPKGLDKILREGIIKGTKRMAKAEFYKEFRYSWLVFDIINAKTGETKKDFRSSADYKVRELFEFLTWLQATAINDGCILESKGQFDKKQRESEGLD